MSLYHGDGRTLRGDGKAVVKKNLYLICNEGCDDTTVGVTEFTDQELGKFLDIVCNLNKNSWYQCMPTIHVYEIEWSDIQLIDDYIENGRKKYGFYPDTGLIDKLYYNGSVYTYRDGVSRYELEKRLGDLVDTHDRVLSGMVEVTFE